MFYHNLLHLYLLHNSKLTFHHFKVWCTSGEGVDAMRVVYRMRGLLGDATEEFVETLSQTNAEAVDDEQVYRMANVLADCGEYLYLHMSYF